MAFRFFNPAEKVSITRGNLPHWQQENATYFVTWRTADSLPQEVWHRWHVERDAWLLAHGIDPARQDWRMALEHLPEISRKDFRMFARTLEHELDACHGACVLRRPELAVLVADALHHFDSERYQLGDFVVMPNHVHLLVGGMRRDLFLTQVESWKKWTALRLNQALGRKGRFWQHESFDHLVRSAESFQRLRHYIAENPTKAALKEGEFLLWQRPDGAAFDVLSSHKAGAGK